MLGFLIARVFGAPPVSAAGFILTACVGGAQLSSYANYLGKGDVALSILLTTGLLTGSVVPVDAIAMSKSILQLVIPFLAMFCTSLRIGSPLAINRDQLLSGEGLRLLVPVLAFHMSAFIIGYWLSKLPVLRYFCLFLLMLSFL
ncbi:unnamed protein product [Victoria cruziana]